MSRSLAVVVCCAAVAVAWRCDAQTLQWPTDSGQSGSNAPWPAQGGGGAPMMAPAAPPMGPGPMTPVPSQAGPPGAPPGGEACMTEFTKLQAETDQRAKATKAASQRKVPREELCKLLQAFEGAIGKWAKYVKDNAAKCGIPPNLVEQLKSGHANIANSAKQVCDTGGLGGGPKAPTLSDALGTAYMPTPEPNRPKAVTGTLNTLTGTPLGQ